MSDHPRALVISDGRIGHQNQSVALCRIMGWEEAILPVAFRFSFSRPLSLVCDQMGIRSGLLLSGLSRLHELGNNFDYVVSTGSRTYYANKVAGKMLGIPSIAVLNPGVLSSGFKLIIVPSYENRFPDSSRVLKVPVNISIPDEASVTHSMTELETRIKLNGRKSWGIIIGGENKTSYIDPAQLKSRLDAIFKLAPPDTAIMVTTSRRSGEEIEKLVQSYGSKFDLTVLASCDSYNPIPAFTRTCERIFVTSDSANMISEIVTAGHAFIEVLENSLKSNGDYNKFLKFIDSLEKMGALHVFHNSTGYANHKIKPAEIGRKIHERLTSMGNERTASPQTPHEEN